MHHNLNLLKNKQKTKPNNKLLLSMYSLGLFLSFFTIPSLLFYQLIICIFILIILIWTLIKYKTNFRLFTNFYSLILLIWLIIALISFYWVKDLQEWFNDIQIIFLSNIYCLATSYLFYSNKTIFISGISKVFILANFLHSIFGWNDIITSSYLFTLNNNMPLSFIRERQPLSSFYNPNDFAFYLLFSSVFLLYKVNLNESLIKKGLLTLMIVSNFILIYFTQSRITILVTLVVFIFYFIFKISSLTHKRLLFFIVIVGTLIFLLVYTQNILEVLSYDGSWTVRIDLIKNGLTYLVDSFFLGVGAGNADYYLESQQHYYVGTIYNLHNWWIEVLVNYGLMFFIIYVIYYFIQLYKSFKNSFYKHTNQSILQVLWLICFILLSTVSSSIFHFIWIWLINIIIFISIENDDKYKNTSIEIY